MEIARLADGSLRIRAVPWGTWVASGALLAFVAVVAILVGEAGRLACRRSGAGQVDCTVTRTSFGIVLSRAELHGLTGASLASTSGRHGRAYRVALAARSGDAPLSTGYSSSGREQKAAMVEEVNRFVQCAGEGSCAAGPGAGELALRETTPWWALALLLVFAGCGAAMSPFFNPVVTWTFDRQAGSLRVHRRSLLARGAAEYRLGEIRSASLKGGRSTQVVLRLASGEQVPMSGIGDGGDARGKEQAVEQIRAFLGLSSAPDPADVAEAMLQQGALAAWSDRPGDRAAGARLLADAARLDPTLQGASRFLSTLAGAPAEAAAAGSLEAAPPALEQAGRAAAERSFAARLVGALALRPAAYRQIAEDPAASRSAAAIVVVASAVVGLAAGMTSGSMPVNGRALPAGVTHGLVRMGVEIAAGLLSWRLSAAVGAAVAKLLRGRTDTGEMLRVLGYASAFRLLWLAPLGFALSWILSAVGTVVAMREAAEFGTAKAAITAAAAWAVAFSVSGGLWLVLTGAAVAALAPAAGW